MNISDRSTASVLIGSIGSTGATAPKIADAYAHAVQISKSASELYIPQDSLSLAVFAALEDGRDPGNDEEVRRIVATNTFANPGITQSLDTLAWEGFRTVCRSNLLTAVKAMRVPFDAGAATLAKAHALIGDVPLEDTATIIARGGEVAEAWAQATKAVKVIDAADNALQALGTITRTSSNDRRYRVLRLAEVDYATWITLELEGRKVSPWEAVRMGLTLSLPTVAEYRERVSVITTAQAQAQMLEQQTGRDNASGKRPANQLLA